MNHAKKTAGRFLGCGGFLQKAPTIQSFFGVLGGVFFSKKTSKIKAPGKAPQEIKSPQEAVTKTIIYPDLLFAVNMSMDLICLYLTGKLLKLPMGKWRLLLSAATGAAFAVGDVLLDLNKAVSAVMTVIFGVIMTLIAFGGCGGARNVVRSAAVLIGTSALTAGLVTLLSSFGEDPKYSGKLGESPAFLILSAAGAAAILIMRLFRTHPKMDGCRVTLQIGSNTYRFPAAVDSGNTLTEPFSGIPVMLVSKKLGERIFKENPRETVKYRLIPTKTATGSATLEGLIPDSVTVAPLSKAPPSTAPSAEKNHQSTKPDIATANAAASFSTSSPIAAHPAPQSRNSRHAHTVDSNRSNGNSIPITLAIAVANTDSFAGSPASLPESVIP